MVVNISELKGRHRGETLWLVASGASLNFVSRYFFQDKLTLVINETCRDFCATYGFAHHRESAQESIDRGLTTIASEYNRCDRRDGLNELRGTYYQYHHPQQPATLVMDMTPFRLDDDTSLIVGSNTVTSAMDFAGRILQVSSIILCGVDSGSIDGQWNYRGYNGSCGRVPRVEDGWIVGGTGVPHVRAQVPLIQEVADALRDRGVAVHSLNPFVDLGLEKHTFAR